MRQQGSNYYIAHPKTASLATAAALEAAGWKEVGGHHGIYPHPIDAKVISVIRDPADWLVSWYHYLKRDIQGVKFGDFIDTFANPLTIDGMPFFGVYCSTHIIFYDSLQEGWDAVMDDIRRPRLKLDRLNVSLGRKNVSEYYDNANWDRFLKRFGDLYSWYQNLHSMRGSELFLRGNWRTPR